MDGLKMSDKPAAEVDALLARLIDLESRLAFQEHGLQALSDALAASRLETTRQSELLERALADLGQLRTLLYADPAEEPPPPHW